jgi:hypothetical protein
VRSPAAPFHDSLITFLNVNFAAQRLDRGPKRDWEAIADHLRPAGKIMSPVNAAGFALPLFRSRRVAAIVAVERGGPALMAKRPAKRRGPVAGLKKPAAARAALPEARLSLSSQPPAATGKRRHQMALHRDIYWVGRQWAVTGFGVQACDQKQKGKFDIEAAKLWEEGVLDGVRALKWLNADDFDRALEVARKYYPEPPRKAAPPQESVPLEESPAPKNSLPPKMRALASNGAAPVASTKPVPAKPEPVKPAPPEFHLRIERASAKLLAQWRIRVRR